MEGARLGRTRTSQFAVLDAPSPEEERITQIAMYVQMERPESWINTAMKCANCPNRTLDGSEGHTNSQ